MSLDLEEKQRDNLEAIRNFTLMDDTFMTQVFSENLAAAEYVLGVILKRDDLKVEQVTTQMPIGNLFGRSVRLDIYARDSENKQYDIEIQQIDSSAAPERARLNSSLFDAKLTHAGQKYHEIPETFVIFITEHDVLGEGVPIYNIERTILQSGKPFHDRAHIVYVNGAYRENDAVGQLMADFHCADYREIKNKTLADSVQYYKENPKGVSNMCKAMEAITEKRENQVRIDNALSMLADGVLSIEKIAAYSGLTVEKVRELAVQQPA